jgi:hypothetical protein
MALASSTHVARYARADPALGHIDQAVPSGQALSSTHLEPLKIVRRAAKQRSSEYCLGSASDQVVQLEIYTPLLKRLQEFLHGFLFPGPSGIVDDNDEVGRLVAQNQFHAIET